MKNIFLALILTLVASTSFAGPKSETFRRMMSVLNKTEQLTPMDVRQKLVKSITDLDSFSFLPRDKMSVVHLREFPDGAAIRISTYERKSRNGVFLDEQEDRIHLRVEMKDMDYTYVGKLRKVFPDVSIQDVSEGNSITTIVETNLFQGVIDEGEVTARLDQISLVLSDLYADILVKHKTGKTILSRGQINTKEARAN